MTTGEIQYLEGKATLKVWSKDHSRYQKYIADSPESLWALVSDMEALVPPPAETVEEFIARGGKIEQISLKGKSIPIEEINKILGL